MNVLGLHLSAEDAANRLGYAVFDSDADLAEKLKLGSSVGATDDPDRLTFIIKAKSDIDGESGERLVKLLGEAWLGFAGPPTTPEPPVVAGEGRGLASR